MSCSDSAFLTVLIAVAWIFATYSPTTFGLFQMIVNQAMGIIYVREENKPYPWIQFFREVVGSNWVWPLWTYFAFNLATALFISVAWVAAVDSYYCYVLPAGSLVGVGMFYWIVILLPTALYLYKIWYSFFLTGTRFALGWSCFFGILAFIAQVTAVILLGIVAHRTGWPNHYIVAFTFALAAAVLMALLAVLITLKVYYLHLKCLGPKNRSLFTFHSSTTTYFLSLFVKQTTSQEYRGEHTHPMKGVKRM